MADFENITITDGGNITWVDSNGKQTAGSDGATGEALFRRVSLWGEGDNLYTGHLSGNPPRLIFEDKRKAAKTVELLDGGTLRLGGGTPKERQGHGLVELKTDQGTTTGVLRADEGSLGLFQRNGDQTVDLAATGTLVLGSPKGAPRPAHTGGKTDALPRPRAGTILLRDDEGGESILLDGKTSLIRVRGGFLEPPDYVFDDDYPLSSLSEVKDHIARRKHLPDIPAGDTITNGGLDLADFSMRLLRKVEELTLYAIDQQEQLAAQEARIRALEGRLAED